MLVVGVAGSGKTTLGRGLAARLAADSGRPWTFADADDVHTPAALAAMARGQALGDADRAPWLARLAARVRAHLDDEVDDGLVLACSALKREYRRTLGADDARVALVWLDAPRDVLAARLAARVSEGEHPVGPSLLPSQLATFEPPGQEALRLDAARPPDTLAAEAAAFVLGTGAAGRSFLPSHLPPP